MNELSELFKLVAEDKKKKKEEFDSVFKISPVGSASTTYVGHW